MTVLPLLCSISILASVHYYRALLFSFLIGILLAPATSLSYVASAQADALSSNDTFTRSSFSLHLGNQTLNLTDSFVLLGNASDGRPLVEPGQHGMLLPVRMLQTSNRAGCFRLPLNVSQLQCGSEHGLTADVARLGLLLQPDASIHRLFAQLYPVARPSPLPSRPARNATLLQPDALPVSPSNATARPSPGCAGRCPCDTTLADALARLARRLSLARCPPIHTVLVLPVADPDSPAPDASSPSGHYPDSFSRQVAVATRQLVDHKAPGVSANPRVIAVAPSPVADQLMTTTTGPDMARAAGLRFNLDIVDDDTRKSRLEEMEARGCRISGWIFFAILILSMIMTMIFTFILSCCFNLGFTISFCDLVIAWAVTITVAISFVLPRFIDPEMMLRLVAFLIDGLVLLSVIIRRVCVLARFHAQCFSVVVGALILTVLISAFGSFAFGFKLIFLYRIPDFTLPDWAISFRWALKGIAIMSISLFTAFGVWCFHMMRQLVVRPRGKHRPYTEPGTGTHRIRGQLPLPQPQASYWQRVTNRQLREMEEEERERQRQRDLEAQADRGHGSSAPGSGNADDNGHDHSRASPSSQNAAKGLGMAGLLAALARPFRRNTKPSTSSTTPPLPSSDAPRALTIETSRSSMSSISSGLSSPFTPPPAPLPFPPRRRRSSYWSPQELHPPPMARPMPAIESNASSSTSEEQAAKPASIDTAQDMPVDAAAPPPHPPPASTTH
ncbi:hypothetical protein SYNPS1DRAFT_30295 [Syncephalis pseudoplumigaleata]|uniref:Uncharacterized protein n=1 Tax=Syncephalis pseudoplumigaleata TaxID=1712513 RepID=A0A4P9YWQ9_9FUNG|nr:hypothetical protein SYNPS1DRAFT_30295 [Syncephalis pseudoplumigaleata]|eukprot:RKP23932.1 hypothetical protein SYNPS1DRAFT_30295 [Syncephalis pseudoplumigaleata]